MGDLHRLAEVPRHPLQHNAWHRTETCPQVRIKSKFKRIFFLVDKILYFPSLASLPISSGQSAISHLCLLGENPPSTEPRCCNNFTAMKIRDYLKQMFPPGMRVLLLLLSLFTSSLSRNEGALLSLANLTSNFFTFPGMRGLPPVATFFTFSGMKGLPPVATFTFHFHLFTFTFARNEGAPSCCYYLHCGNFDYPVVPDTANDIENAKDYNER